MLEVRREDHVLVSCFTWQLDPQVPRRQGYESKGGLSSGAGVLGHEMLVGKGVEAVDGVAEGTSVLDMLPGEGGERSAEGSDGRVDGTDEHGLAVQLQCRFISTLVRAGDYSRRCLVSQTHGGSDCTSPTADG